MAAVSLSEAAAACKVPEFAMLEPRSRTARIVPDLLANNEPRGDAGLLFRLLPVHSSGAASAATVC